MSLGIECLLTEDAALAREMAAQLDGMNQDRKSIEQGMQREALAQLKDLPVDSMPFGLCLFDPEWHQGVIGILASRMKERYFRPTIAFADAGDGLLKGRGVRSGLPYSRCPERGSGAASEPDQQIRWPRHGRRSDAAGSEFSAVRRGF
jgi:single-stranded DNA-specific DHH superfamily exonuclease